MNRYIREQINADKGVVIVLHALQTKWPGTGWVGNGTEYDGIDWGEGNDIPKPSKADIDTEIARLQAEWDSLEYARNREIEYPTLMELTVALYDEDDKAAIETKRAAIKKKWPKDNTGPVE